MKVLLLLIPLLAASCGHQPALPNLPIPKAVEVAPSVAKIRPSLDRASQAAATLAADAAALNREAADARDDAARLAGETSRLASTGTATAAELASLAARAATQSTRADHLANDLIASQRTVVQLTTALDESRTAQAEALQAASSGDATQHLLASQVQSLASQYETTRSTLEKLQPQLAVKSARIAQLTRWLIILTLICLLYLAARLLKLTPYARPFLFWLP